MTCLDKYLKGIVYVETGKRVYCIPDGGVCGAFSLCLDALVGLHVMAGCVVFMGVYYNG